MLRAERSSARRSRLGPRRARAATSGSAYPRVSVVLVRRLVRNVSSTASARARCLLVGHARDRSRARRGRGAAVGRVVVPVVRSSSAARRRSEPRDSGGLPRPKSWSASSTAGSSSQVTGAPPAEAAKSASRARRPSGSVRFTQRAGPFRLPSEARRARSRSGSTTDSGTVRRRATLVRHERDERARPAVGHQVAAGRVGAERVHADPVDARVAADRQLGRAAR